MTDPSGYSPSFKRPAEILRLRRSRARSVGGLLFPSSGPDSPENPGQSRSSPGELRPFSPGPRLLGRNSPARKRRNPFASLENAHSPNKKQLVLKDDGEPFFLVKNPDRTGENASGDSSSEDREVFSSRRDSSGSEPDRTPDGQERLLLQDLLNVEEEAAERPLLKSPQAIAPASIAPPTCREYPADWSLKTRLLFTSPLSLSWTEQPKAQEEAVGLSNSCRAQFSVLPQSLQDPQSSSETRCAFQQNLVYWQHPSLPWLSLFPRINAERSFSGKGAPWAHDAALQQSLMREWSASLSSLYSLLKSRRCPYFYVCSYQFTVLFRAAGLAGSDSITAVVSPTTLGLREAMKAEGIEFSLPLVNVRKKHSDLQDGQNKEPNEACWKKLEAEGGGRDDEDDSFQWLKDMGVQDKIKKPDGITIKLQKDAHSLSVDHRPESVVCVEGSHTFTLINFLINCKSVVASTGSQAGLPPTLLAPTVFRGATLHTLKSRSVNVKNQVKSGFQNLSSLEIAGPVLPSSLHAIIGLLRSAQKGNFSASLYTHTPTAVMNVNAFERKDTPVDLSDIGLPPTSVEQLKQPPGLGPSGLTHISMNDYSYSWRS
ncbi:downstream neighbor of son-like protein [Oryzias melastigma]|uniref:Downstream neighbor of son-like protein n=1 Tax=Oryzias melastigma TaxID=30732 RepID=A0A834FN29_ORYME|nr:downstream neighbor of son-like protein [Oryzias melastigma]